MKNLIILVLVTMFASANIIGQINKITLANVDNKNDVKIVEDACKKLEEFGLMLSPKDVVFFKTKEQTENAFETVYDKEKALNSVAFANFGKFPIYINTWDTKLWKNLVDVKIVESKMRLSAVVIVASLLAHEGYHATEPITDFQNLTEVQKQLRVYQSEIMASELELSVLNYFKSKGIKYLDIPIQATKSYKNKFETLIAKS